MAFALDRLRDVEWTQRKLDALKAYVLRKKTLLRQAWKRGCLWWLLDAHQIRAYWRIKRALRKPFARFVLNWARRTGKTWLLQLIAIEHCIQTKGARVNVAAATKESLTEFIWPTIEAILESCPTDLRPKVDRHKGKVTFRNRARMVLAGCNDARGIERLRGPFATLNLFEEIGALPSDPGLDYINRSILKPQLLTTGGGTLMAGTPPKSPGHEAGALFLKAEADGDDCYSHATLFDNPRLSSEQVTAYLESDAKDAGFRTVDEYKESPDYRREWLAIVETDPTFAVLPDATKERILSMVKDVLDRPLFADRYESMDLGFSPDWTALLFGYWDFERQKLVIEHELLVQRFSDTALAEAVGGKRDGDGQRIRGEEGLEWRLWGTRHRGRLERWADNTYPMTLQELSLHHDLLFSATAKDEKEAAIVQVTRWIRQGKIEIVPHDPTTGLGCRYLQAQMQAAVWNKARTQFERSKEFGHFDLVDALIYMVRNVIPNVDRIPEGWGKSQETHWIPQGPTQQERLLVALGG